MGQLAKKNKSSLKNFWIFRIAGMLAGIGAIKYDINKTSNNNDVISFMNCLHEANDALTRANDLLKKIDYTKIVK